MLAVIVNRVRSSIAGRVRSIRALPAFNINALRELWQERQGSFAVGATSEPHLVEAIDWLTRAQDATPDDGIARGFGLVRDSYSGWSGWQPSYPETTGYIIPTLYAAAERLDRPALAARAERAARWEIDVQLENGAVRGGVIGQPKSPAVFNTGQVLFGWLAAARVSGDSRFEDAARRAGTFLVSALGTDEVWLKGRSKFARGGAELYNARTAWALAETGFALEEPAFRDAAHRVLRAVASRQFENGWFPDCCLNDPAKPLLHTVAYTIRGLIEGGRVLGDESLIRAGGRAADALRVSVAADGRMPGRYRGDWSGAVEWSCLTGQAQMANNWLRLYAITREAHWLETVAPVLGFLKGTQNRASPVDGIRGGIRGSSPVSGAYGPYEVLSWATKFFADALMRHERVLAGLTVDEGISHLG